jgi:hypothetical protein
MRKGFFAICSVLLLLVVSIGVLGLGCGPTGRGYIIVSASLCDELWQGALDYTLTGANSTIDYTAVTYSFNVDPGTWTCEYVSGGPPGAHLVDITPDPTQEVSADELITFNLTFELDQDAWIEFETWTIDGVPIEEWDGYWDYEPGLGYYAEVTWCNVIDVHYTQGVEGCEGRQVTLDEVDELVIHYLLPELGGPIPLYVFNDDCAVNKTAELEPAEKLGQVPSFNGEPVEPDQYLELPWGVNTTLDVETSWELEKCLNYTKSVRWFHVGECFEPPCNWCVLFNLEVPGPGYDFQLWPSACVELADDVDVNPDNNCTEGPPLYLQIVPM